MIGIMNSCMNISEGAMMNLKNIRTQRREQIVQLIFEFLQKSGKSTAYQIRLGLPRNHWGVTVNQISNFLVSEKEKFKVVGEVPRGEGGNVSLWDVVDDASSDM